MLQNIKQLDEGLKSLVSKELENVSSLDIFLVTRVNYEEYKADIKQLNSSLVYKDVDISSIMLGNGKGLLIPPSVNDLVLVGFLNGHMNSPIIIGSIFNRNMIEPDSILDIREDEVFLGNKINGSYFFIDENNNIKLKLASSGGIYLDDLKMPATSGLSGQVLSSDGAGNAVWVGTGSGGYYNFNSPLSVDALNVYLNLHSNGKLKVSTDAIPDLNTLQLDDTKIDHLDKTLNTGLVTVTNGTGLIGSTPNNTGDWDTAYGWGDHAGLYDAVGTASSEVGTHEFTYDHDLISTALQDITGQSIGDLSDVNTTGVDDGKILKWNGVDSFVMADDENTTYDSSDFDHDQLTNTHQSVTTLSSPEFVEVKLSSTSTNNDSAVRYDQLMSVVAGLDWQQSVLAFLNLVTSEPAAPTLGDRYINTATGDSSETTQAVTENYIYEWNGDDWTEIVPNTGFTVWVEGLDTNYTFNATWVEFGSTISHNNTTGLQGGTTSEYYHLTQDEYAGLNISDWDTAYGWGNHADVGYLTSETDPDFAAWLLATPPLYPGGWYDTLQSNVDISGFNNDSGFITGVAWDEITGDQTDISLSGFTDDLSYEVPLTFSTGLTRTDNTITCDITQYTDSDAIDAIQGDASWNATDWDTAYGWGNHADGGYLTSLAGAVLTDQTTPQTIGDTTNRLAKLWASDLVVDNINLNGSTITGVSDANTVLTAYTGRAIAVEGVSFDGGAVTGVTTLSMNNQLTNSVAVGTAPFVVTSTTKVDNLHVARATLGDTITVSEVETVSYNTGWVSPGTISGSDYTNPDNLKTTDTYATLSLPSGTASHYFCNSATNFGFSIPEGAIITGVEIRVLAKCSHKSTTSPWNIGSIFYGPTTQLVYDGSAIKSGDWGFATIISTDDEIYVKGSSSNLWTGETTLTSDIINDASFGIIAKSAIQADTETVTISAHTLQLKIYYTLKDETCSIAMFESSTGDLAIKTDSGLTYNPNTGLLTATGFSGPLAGNVTGNCSGTAATVTEASQTNITSLGTLTSLTVDNINLNGSTITGVSDANTVLTAYAGKAISVEGVSFDGGEVSGVTTLTMNNQLISTLVDGTAPFDIISTTKVNNLNVEQVDGADLSIDGTLATNSDALIPSQKAVKTYADTKTTLAAVKADADIASAISLKHAAVTVTASRPLRLSTQLISVANEANNEVTGIETTWTDSDTKISSSKAMATKAQALIDARLSAANATDLTDSGATTLHKHSYNNLDDKPTIPTIEDTAVDGHTTIGISSNVAFDIKAIADAALPNSMATAKILGRTTAGTGAIEELGAIPSAITATTQAAGTNNTTIATTAYAYALVSDAAYASGWNGVGAIAPSKNAVYDKIESIEKWTSVAAASRTDISISTSGSWTDLDLTNYTSATARWVKLRCHLASSTGYTYAGFRVNGGGTDVPSDCFWHIIETAGVDATIELTLEMDANQIIEYYLRGTNLNWCKVCVIAYR